MNLGGGGILKFNLLIFHQTTCIHISSPDDVDRIDHLHEKDKRDKDLMMGLQRGGPSIVAVKSNTAVPVKETVFIATAMPSCRNGRAGVWKHLFVCIEIRT